MTIKAILFDIDGVLADSAESNVPFYQEILQKAGYPIPPREEILHHSYLTIKDSIIFYAKEADPKKIETLLRIGKDTPYPVDQIKTPPHAERIVVELAQRYTLGLVSNRVREGIIWFYKLFGHKELFRVAISADDIVHPKPDPEMVILAMKKLGVTADETVYVGDMPVDMRAGKAAGVTTILLSKADNPEADYRIEEIEELSQLLRGITK